MICFARSGGTILNQCLGSLPNVVILSEVNPLGGGSGKKNQAYKTIEEQAKNWYQIDIKSDKFTDKILQLESICQSHDLNLIVRDWTFINFMPEEDNDFQPPQKLLTIEALQDKCDLNIFAFVRDSIDVWISRNTPDTSHFFNLYLKYIEAVINAEIPIFKYEEFCDRPDSVMEKICDLSEINYQGFNQDYLNFDNLNGDIQLQSRGRKQGKIKPLPRKLISRAKIAEINQCQAMIQANKLLNYPTYYQSVPRESLVIKGLNYLSRIAARI